MSTFTQRTTETHLEVACDRCPATKRFMRGDDRATLAWKLAHRCWKPDVDVRKPWFVA